MLKAFPSRTFGRPSAQGFYRERCHNSPSLSHRCAALPWCATSRSKDSNTHHIFVFPGSAEPYSELGPLYTRLRAETESLMQHCRAAGLVVTGALTAGLTVEAASAIAAAVPATVPGEMHSGHERNAWALYLYAGGIHVCRSIYIYIHLNWICLFARGCGPVWLHGYFRAPSSLYQASQQGMTDIPAQ